MCQCGDPPSFVCSKHRRLPDYVDDGFYDRPDWNLEEEIERYQREAEEPQAPEKRAW